MKPQVRYWDSNCFLGWLKGESDKKERCAEVLKAAEGRKIKIATSALTLVEVLRLKGEARISKKDSKTIEDFFRNPYIIVQNLDRRLAEKARELVWEKGSIQPKDAIHLATAIINRIPIIDTFDQYLIKLDGKMGNPLIRIGYPNME